MNAANQPTRALVLLEGRRGTVSVYIGIIQHIPGIRIFPGQELLPRMVKSSSIAL